MYGTFTGSSVASVVDGDVIIIEIWFRITQATASTFADTFCYDGPTETNNNNTTVSNRASFIETPQTLTFGAGGGGPAPGRPVNYAFSLSKYLSMDLGNNIILGANSQGGRSIAHMRKFAPVSMITLTTVPIPLQ